MNQFFKKCIFLFCFCALLSTLVAHKGAFERAGDVGRMLPVFVGVAVLAMDDYVGFKELGLATLSTQLAIEGIKRGFEFAKKRGVSVAFAKRPCCEDYKGMPSGHAGGAFSAAFFVYHRYGWRAGLPVSILATATAYSRVYARKHSFWQVLGGGVIAYGFSYIFTTKYGGENLIVAPVVDSGDRGVWLGLEVVARF